MTHEELPEDIRRFYGVETVEELWRKILLGGNSRLRRFRRIFGMLPSNPRCTNCHRPFAGVGGALLRLLQGTHKSGKNPRFCADCHSFTSQFPGGANVELSMLFVDVRGSTSLAENMPDDEFSALMNRFYDATIDVLVRADAFIDKLVGDEVTALFFPGYAGRQYASKAVRGGQDLLRVTGHADPDGPWVPVRVGVHTGKAWVGSIRGAKGRASDFTALGDNVNVAARLASEAGAGELLISEATLDKTGVE